MFGLSINDQSATIAGEYLPRRLSKDKSRINAVQALSAVTFVRFYRF